MWSVLLLFIHLWSKFMPTLLQPHGVSGLMAQKYTDYFACLLLSV